MHLATTMRMQRFALMATMAVLAGTDALVGAARAADAPWLTDFAAAREQAAKDNKEILVNFTGSDWCGWCVTLEREVFSQAEFQDFAKSNLVLVKCDFPKNWQQIPEVVRNQNVALRRQYGLTSFPTIVLLDSKARPYAKTGYLKGGAPAYLKHLAELRTSIRDKRDAAWNKAKIASGVAKAQALADGLATIDDDLVTRNYLTMVAEIQALDPQDTTGIAKKNYAAKAKLVNLREAIKDTDRAAAFKLVDTYIADNKLNGVAAQEIQMLKLERFNTSSAADCDPVIKLMDEIIALDPASALAGGATNVKNQATSRKKKLEQDAAAKAGAK